MRSCGNPILSLNPDRHGWPDLSGLSSPEQRAAVAVERVTGATATAHDIDGRQGAYDFALNYNDGRTAAVEVTSHAAGKQFQLEALLAKRFNALENPGQWSWTIRLSDPVDIPKLETVYKDVIRICEHHLVPSPFLLPWQLKRENPALRWLTSSTVSMHGDPDLPAVDGDRRRPVWVMPEAEGGSVDYNLVGIDQAVADLLAVPTVARRIDKVSKADTDEHHLFVHVHDSGFPPPITLGLWGHPGQLPSTSVLLLPKPLSHLWIAPSLTNVLLGWTSDGGWQAHDVLTRLIPPTL